MCTGIRYKNYFGRNLDYEFSYGQEIIITPRNYKFNFKHTNNINNYAIIGAGIIQNNYPLYFDGINEKGLGIAGLNFVGNCVYYPLDDSKINIAQYEFIPYILTNFKDIDEVKNALKNINLDNEAISDKYPLAQLHWLIADKDKSIVVESTKNGLQVYDNDLNVLTNNPPFNMQVDNFNLYNLSPEDLITPDTNKIDYSRGTGTIGLPGDLSSKGRFVKVAYTNKYSLTLKNDLSEAFHILHSVEQQYGCCKVKENEYEYTIYSSMCDLSNGVYYYTTYNNHQINGVDMKKEDLNSSSLITYPMLDSENINIQN